MNPNDFIGLAGVPFLVFLVEAIKKMFPDLPARFLPAVSMATGVVLNIGLALLLAADWRTAAFVGMIAGAVASGTFAYGKAREIEGG
jgi:hypothetical protein